MSKKNIIRRQFNKQAKKFSSWIGTNDERMLQELFDFISISECDELLDVACGSGEFAIFCARRIKRIHGIDISSKMIELAKEQVTANQIPNLSFACHDVEDLPFESNSFSVVTSRSAFHHMESYPTVFKEMVRCCQGGGLLCVDDIAAYNNPGVNSFFDELDKAIDVSHNARIAENELRNLFTHNGVKILKAMNLEFEIGFELYMSHAIQTERAVKEIDELLHYGLNESEISDFLYRKNDHLVFKNKAFRIVGRKK